VIVLTCSSNASDNIRAFELGVRDYIVKPLDLYCFLTAVSGALESLDWQHGKTWCIACPCLSWHVRRAGDSLKSSRSTLQVAGLSARNLLL
jgi:DNA-binding response OmpR family regulator